MSEVTTEYRTIVSHGGWTERTDRGRLLFTGRDVLPFLQALVTNDVSALQPGSGVYVTYLTPHGRMLADMELYGRPNGVLAVVAQDLSAPLATRFDQLVFTEDVRCADISAGTTELFVTGGRSPELIAAAFHIELDRLATMRELDQIDYADGFVAKSGAAHLPAFSVLTATDRRAEAVSRLETAGAGRLSAELLEALRIEAGRPRWGRELTTDTIPLEAGLLERAISTSKGCYVGQEIIVRILHRGGGRVARRLVRVHLPHSAGRDLAGATLEDGGHAVGLLTSAAPALSDDGMNALAYVQRDAAEIGRTYQLAGGGPATVTGLAG